MRPTHVRSYRYYKRINRIRKGRARTSVLKCRVVRISLSVNLPETHNGYAMMDDRNNAVYHFKNKDIHKYYPQYSILAVIKSSTMPLLALFMTWTTKNCSCKQPQRNKGCLPRVPRVPSTREPYRTHIVDSVERKIGIKDNDNSRKSTIPMRRKISSSLSRVAGLFGHESILWSESEGPELPAIDEPEQVTPNRRNLPGNRKGKAVEHSAKQSSPHYSKAAYTSGTLGDFDFLSKTMVENTGQDIKAWYTELAME
ncbi:MAG: hypothetical protein Q9226_009241, partial [Calogaya cf. arnoldii]